jgi:membrane protein YdbS with pleckstrin-like domain
MEEKRNQASGTTDVKPKRRVSLVDIIIFGVALLCTAVMAILKITDVISVSWWVIVSPFWGLGALILLLCLAIAILYIALVSKRRYLRRKKLRAMQRAIDAKKQA